MCLAVPGQVLELSTDEPLCRTGRVRFGGVVKQVYVAFVPEAKVGDYVLVHAGCAISVLDEAQAQRVFATLAELDLVDPVALGGQTPECAPPLDAPREGADG